MGEGNRQRVSSRLVLLSLLVPFLSAAILAASLLAGQGQESRPARSSSSGLIQASGIHSFPTPGRRMHRA